MRLVVAMETISYAVPQVPLSFEMYRCRRLELRHEFFSPSPLHNATVTLKIEQGTLHSKCQLSLVSQTPTIQYRYTMLGWVPVATRPRNPPSRFRRKLGDPTAYWPVHTEYTGSQFPRRPHCKWGGGGSGADICPKAWQA